MFKTFPIFFYPEGDEGGNQSNQNTPNQDANGGGNGNQQQDRTFTQAELDAILSDRLKRAQDSTQKTFLTSLGVESLDDVKTALSEFQKLKDSQLSEAEKLQKELDTQRAAAEKARTEADTAIAQANERLMRAAVIAEASKSDYGVHEDARADVWLFIDKEAIKLNDSGEFDGIGDAIKKVLESKPYLKEDTAVKGGGTPSRLSKTKRPPNLDKKTADKPAIRF